MDQLAEVETFSKPGTADVTASDRKKLSGLLKHYAKMAHPFSTCKRDQMKHGLSEEHANRRCAVIKDLIKGTTKWRGKGKEKAKEERIAEQLAHDAWDLLEAAHDLLGPNMVAAIVATENNVGLEAELVDTLKNAGKVLEAVPKWMLPPEARKKGFKPTDPPKDGDFEKKHKRGDKGTSTGGKFVAMGSSGEATQGALAAMPTVPGSPTTFDEAARRQTIRFQKSKGIAVDGKIGHQTVVAMRGGDATKIKPGPLTASDRAWLRKQTSKGNKDA